VSRQVGRRVPWRAFLYVFGWLRDYHRRNARYAPETPQGLGKGRLEGRIADNEGE